MSEALFRIDGARVFPSQDTRGPWDPTTQHGGAPAALLAWALDALPAPVPMRLARFTMDLFRPAPIAPLEIATEIVREGRNIQMSVARLIADGKEVARATALKIREAAFDIPPEARMRSQSWPHPDECPPFGRFTREGLGTVTDIRTARATEDPRDGWAAWFRLAPPMIDGADTTPNMRAAMSADYMNGLSAVLDFETWIFINADLSVHYARTPRGEWILVDAQSLIGPEGRGLAHANLYDLDGLFGRAAQSIMVAPR
ncbi:MAG: thioesterase family protein [Hyphomonadaceae bacterium]|nr:thioesterase family protein [Hyphomonadaceae bacterium]